MQLRELTKAEEEIMRVLWQLKKGFVKDVLAELPEPKPAYNTVSTIIRILEKKELVGYTAYGKTHEYYPLITEEEYRRFQTEQLMANYFDNSLKKLVSFFVQDKNISLSEADEIINLLNKKKDQ
ncbi:MULTISPECIES: BlaI/MecI/CopY family transcriptional regulator [Spirosoma]|uniref:BlaI/MecI/CopY family transcriptional regulator n=1 Tax=Spirosoma liriopis TaxID=2937440 RepID=A0ABT0HJP5_9BACT|nr:MULTISPECIES: BlaI/MecI/CopY family transcriptional regulator [Spirosoma]MCK8492388.1 BlaI/MecI/CopY family transcriptional regulator [Spirosoma liriopis]UHG91861.1 BlaI/MecI/CopY family transcriptional regulator [Spirosoma oryzicola]